MLQVYNINQISMSVQWPTNTRTSKYVAAYYQTKKKRPHRTGRISIDIFLDPFPQIRMIYLDNLM